jgi:O-antigen ligase/tetratricopeptide (TPR) repeat protein
MTRWLPAAILALLALPFDPFWLDAEAARRALLLVVAGLLALPVCGRPAGERTGAVLLLLIGWQAVRAIAPAAAPGFERALHWLALGVVFAWAARHDAMLWLRAALPAAFLASAYGLLVRLGFEWPYGYALAADVVSTLGNRNVAAEFVTAGGACALAVAARAPRPAWALLTLLLAAAYLVVNGSRSALALPAVALLGLGARWIAVPRGLLVVLALVLGGTLGRVLPAPAASPGGGLGRTAPTLEVRQEIWRGCARMAAGAPILGLGTGAFGSEYPRYRGQREIELSTHGRQFATRVENPHNDHLEILVETGAIGLLLWLWFLCAGLRRWWRQDPLVLLPILAFLLTSLVRAPLGNAPAAALAFGLLGAARAGRSLEQPRWLGTLQGVALLLLLGIVGGARLLAEHATARHLEARRFHANVLLFGGSSQGLAEPGVLFADTWEWNGVRWAQRSPAAGPSARWGHALAYDSARLRVVLFGGAGGDGALGDTWEWDGASWSERRPAVSPPARHGHAMAYDVARQRVVLFGGHGASGNLSDTWEWDGSNWTQRLPATHPSPRAGGSALAYDVARRRSVLSCGVPGDHASSETWEWDGTNWSRAEPAASPPARYGRALAYDHARRRILLFGGAGIEFPLADAWEWDGASWLQRNPASSPPARHRHALAYDVVRQRVVLCGGTGQALAGSGARADTWEWDGTAWHRQAAAGPPARHSHAMAYSASSARVAAGREWLDVAIRFHPDPTLLHLRAQQQKNIQDAFDDLTLALQERPHSTTLLIARADLANILGQPATAIADLERALALDPREPTACLMLASIHAGGRRTAQAIATLYHDPHPQVMERLAGTFGQFEALARKQGDELAALAYSLEGAFLRTLEALRQQPGTVASNRAVQDYASRTLGAGIRDPRPRILTALQCLALGDREGALALVPPDGALLDVHRRLLGDTLAPLLELPGWKEWLQRR